MDKHLTSDRFVNWLAQEAQSIVQTTRSSENAAPELWGIATDALDWLRHASPDDREKALQEIKRCLDIGTATGVTVPEDEYEAKCFVTLLRYVSNPPRLL